MYDKAALTKLNHFYEAIKVYDKAIEIEKDSLNFKSYFNKG